jgi:hypothetical protein
VEERLLLDRIALHSADISPGSVERAAPVIPNLADARLSFGNRATVTAGIAPDAIAIKLFDKVGIGLADARIEDVAEGGHVNILSLNVRVRVDQPAPETQARCLE